MQDPIFINVEALANLRQQVSELNDMTGTYNDATDKLKRLRNQLRPDDPSLINAEVEYKRTQSAYESFSTKVIESLGALSKHHYDILRGPYQCFKRCQHDFYSMTASTLSEVLAPPIQVISPRTPVSKPEFLRDRIKVRHGSSVDSDHQLAREVRLEWGSDIKSVNLPRPPPGPPPPSTPYDKSQGPPPDEIIRIVPTGVVPKQKTKEMVAAPIVPTPMTTGSSALNTSTGTRKRDFFAPPRKKIEVGFLSMKICGQCGALIQKQNVKFCSSCGFQLPPEAEAPSSTYVPEEVETVGNIQTNSPVLDDVQPSLVDDTAIGAKLNEQPITEISDTNIKDESAITETLNTTVTTDPPIVHDVESAAVEVIAAVSEPEAPKIIPVALAAPPRDSATSKKKKKKGKKDNVQLNNKADDIAIVEDEVDLGRPSIDNKEVSPSLESSVPDNVAVISFPNCPSCDAKATKADPKFCMSCGYKYSRKKPSMEEKETAV